MGYKKILGGSFTIVAVVIGLWLLVGVYASKQSQTSKPDAILGSTSTRYSNTMFGFEVLIPVGFTVDEAYLNQDMGPGKEIPGVAFRIPESMTTGTNLSPDSHVAVERLVQTECDQDLFIDTPLSSSEIVVGDIHYTKVTGSGAGAGNRYEESIYMTQKEDMCYALRYFIHSTNIENYDKGSVKEYDHTAVMTAFEGILNSLSIH